MSPQQTLENVDGPSSDDTLTDTPSRIKPLAAPASSPSSPLSSYVGMALVIAITYATYPDNLIPDPHQPASIHHVWYHGWITAISTGLGVLPLVFVSDFNKFWVGISNAVAAGMMMGASHSLLYEGWTFSDPSDTSTICAEYRSAIGCAVGLAFIMFTKSFIDSHEDLEVGNLVGADAKKVLLIVLVMTLHSLTEGVGIGVSFGGSHGHALGVFISASLAVHNVPEGLAVAVVLLPRGVSKLSAALWCIFTSVPQPIMAVPAYLFVEHFIPFLPAGLGFAGGAMLWVALAELLVEAIEDTNYMTTAVVSSTSLVIMKILQEMVKHES
uniref:Uncharacterized protein n=1 Tax=Corethron hystrix TaxID=216773 RepID=A0A7S1FXS5_9STRA|mmetsp:Transcript_35912/g.83757  ORF Transcript_35912/g.83757 Transcript_35912/m.83757 type:complete len:327 (+) Transcript_35912:354-1334(+)